MLAEQNPLDPDRSSELMAASRSALLLIDVQERLLPAIPRGEELVSTIRFLLDAAHLLQVPAAVSEQYPRGLGRTVAELSEHAATIHLFEKLTFSAGADVVRIFPQTYCRPSQNADKSPDGDSAPDRLTEPDGASESDDASAPARDQLILCGIEAHICVLQTALDLLACGYQVAIVADAIGSRRTMDREIAIQRMRDCGCTVLTSESVVFEWCVQAGSDVFRSLSRLVRQRPL